MRNLNVTIVEELDCDCYVYDCCDCGGFDCGCEGCYSCNCCELCMAEINHWC
jgi:hypothetical protein